MPAKLTNDFFSITATGLALDDHQAQKRQAYFVSGVGHKGALKAVWASLVNNAKPTVYCREYSSYNRFSLAGVGSRKQLWAPLPGTAYGQAAFWVQDPSVLLAIHPQGAMAYDRGDWDHLQKLKQEAMPDIYRRLVYVLNLETEIPILSEWGETLWQATWAENAYINCPIVELSCYGDCVGGWKIKTSWNWLNLTQRLLMRGALTL